MEKITAAREISGIRPMNVLGGIVPLCVPYVPSSDFADEAARRADPRIRSLWGRLGLEYLMEEQPAPAVSSQVTVNNFTSELIFRIFAKNNTDRLIERYQPGFVLPENLRSAASRHTERLQKELVRSVTNTLTYDRMRTEQISGAFRLLFEEQTSGIPLQTVLRTLSTLVKETSSGSGMTTERQEYIYKRISEVLSAEYPFHPAAKAVSEKPLKAVDYQTAQKLLKLARVPSDSLAEEAAKRVLSLAESGRTPEEAGSELLREVRFGVSGGDSFNIQQNYLSGKPQSGVSGRVLPVSGAARNTAAVLALAADQLVPEENGRVTSQTLSLSSAQSRIARAAEQGAERLIERFRVLALSSGDIPAELSAASVKGQVTGEVKSPALLNAPQGQGTVGNAHEGGSARVPAYARTIVRSIASGEYVSERSYRPREQRAPASRHISITAGTLKRILMQTGSAEEQVMLSGSASQGNQAFRETAELLERYMPEAVQTSPYTGQETAVPQVSGDNAAVTAETGSAAEIRRTADRTEASGSVGNARAEASPEVMSNASGSVVPDISAATAAADTVHMTPHEQSDDGLFRKVGGRSASYRDKLDQATLNALDKLVEEGRAARRASAVSEGVLQTSERQGGSIAEIEQNAPLSGSVKTVPQERREVSLSGLPQQSEGGSQGAVQQVSAVAERAPQTTEQHSESTAETAQTAPLSGTVKPLPQERTEIPLSGLSQQSESGSQGAVRQASAVAERALQTAEQQSKSPAETAQTVPLTGTVKPLPQERTEIPLSGLSQQSESGSQGAVRQASAVAERALQTAEQQSKSPAETAQTVPLTGTVKPLPQERREVSLSGLSQQSESDSQGAVRESVTQSGGQSVASRNTVVERDSVTAETSQTAPLSGTVKPLPQERREIPLSGRPQQSEGGNQGAVQQVSAVADRAQQTAEQQTEDTAKIAQTAPLAGTVKPLPQERTEIPLSGLSQQSDGDSHGAVQQASAVADRAPQTAEHQRKSTAEAVQHAPHTGTVKPLPQEHTEIPLSGLSQQSEGDSQSAVRQVFAVAERALQTAPLTGTVKPLPHERTEIPLSGLSQQSEGDNQGAFSESVTQSVASRNTAVERDSVTAETSQTAPLSGTVKPLPQERGEVPLSGLSQQIEGDSQGAVRQASAVAERAPQTTEQHSESTAETSQTAPLSGTVKPLPQERREIPLSGLSQQSEGDSQGAVRQAIAVADRALQTTEQHSESPAESAQNAPLSGTVKPLPQERGEVPLSGLSQQIETEAQTSGLAENTAAGNAGRDGGLRRVAIVRESIVSPTSGHIARLMHRAQPIPERNAVRQAFTFRQSGGADEMVMLVPPKEMDRFTAQNPYMSQLPPVELKEKPQPEKPAENRRIITQSSPAKVSTSTDISVDRMSREEITRLADKVYERIESRLARDRRRMGL